MEVGQSISKWGPHSEPHQRQKVNEEKRVVEAIVLVFLERNMDQDKSNLLAKKHRIEQYSFPIFSHDVMEHASQKETCFSVLGLN